MLARRLSDHGAYSVLLIEKGDAGDSCVVMAMLSDYCESDTLLSWIHRNPLLSMHHFSDRKHSTMFQSAHDDQLNRPLTLTTGLGLGGCTRINGGQYTCGVSGEYNAWAQAGNEGWSYEDLKVYFKKSEKWIGPVPREFHGIDGEPIDTAIFLETQAIYSLQGPLQVRSFDKFEYASCERYTPVLCTTIFS